MIGVSLKDIDVRTTSVGYFSSLHLYIIYKGNEGFCLIKERVIPTQVRTQVDVSNRQEMPAPDVAALSAS